MERKNILTSQKEVVKNWKSGFKSHPCDEGIKYIYEGDPSEGMLTSAETYCALIGIDYQTVKRFGEVSYSVEYNCVNDLYILRCETYIGNIMSEPLSVEYEDNEDWLGFYGETFGKTDGDKLPQNWKELITDEQLHDILRERNIQTIECLNDDDVPDEMKERIAKDWCSNNSEELSTYLSDEDERDIAYNYAESNPLDLGEEVCRYIGSSDAKDLIYKLLEEL